MPTALSVNLNKIALLRNSRDSDYPSIATFAQLAIDAGADGLTIHPRPDQRHIRVKDVLPLADLCRTNPSIEFNIEGNPFAGALSSANGLAHYPGLLSLIERARPDQVTLVPDSNNQLTSDHGFDLKRDGTRLKHILRQLKDWGIRTSLFMDPKLEQIELAKAIGADRIELYTGPYAAAFEKSPSIIEEYRAATKYAHEIGLGVNAGHDLNLQNLPLFLSIGHIAEVSIGHALTVDALLSGYKSAILNYSRCCKK
ncbi:MAG: pyridoxine 5-phosphate synthase [Cellvibrionaceae bacterium]|jgi:pyridoxine 5-phosphate synthase